MQRPAMMFALTSEKIKFRSCKAPTRLAERAIFIFFLAFAFNFVFAVSVFAQTKNCTTAACHNEIKAFNNLHGPTKVNGCTVCHRSGEATKVNGQLYLSKNHFPKNHPAILPLLPQEINSTCLLCHDDKNAKGFAFAHKAIVERTCVSCHNPHGSNNKHLLRIASTAELCFSCHKDFKEQAHGGHQGVLTQNKSCFNCHEAHFSHEANLLKLKPALLCLQCHNKEIVTSKGTSLVNIQKIIESNPHRHKPVQEGKCQSCHNPHGSNEQAFLKKNYSKTTPQLCLDCHKNVNSEPQTQELTNFRNGNVNLHYYHLNEIKKPLNCQTCHEVHASTQDLLIRTSTIYNTWQLPIQYRKLADGGSCLAACHKVKTYRRSVPFSNEAGK